MEEDTSSPRRNDTLPLGSMRATRSSSMRFNEPQGRTKDPLVQSHRSTRSSAPPPYAPRYSHYGFIIMTKEEKKKLTRLEKRLVANVDFDDQASKCWVSIRIFTTCWDTSVGCNTPTECR
jgi:hypothetical protein